MSVSFRAGVRFWTARWSPPLTQCIHSRRGRRHIVEYFAAIGVDNPRHSLRAADCNRGNRQRRIGEAAAGKSGLARPPRAKRPPKDRRTAPRAEPALAVSVEDRQRTFDPTDVFVLEVDRPSERRARTPFAVVAAAEPAADRLALNFDYARATRTLRRSNGHRRPPLFAHDTSMMWAAAEGATMPSASFPFPPRKDLGMSDQRLSVRSPPPGLEGQRPIVE